MDTKTFLLKLSEKGLRDRQSYLDNDRFEEYVDRLDLEHTLITDLDFQDYILIVWDIVRLAKLKGVMVGVGRGSVGGSLIAYLIGITDIDPIKHNLLFERFMNETRSSFDPPDIDLDFQASRRDEVKEYVYQKYGLNRVCEVGTLSKTYASTSIRDVSKQFNLPFQELNSIIAGKLNDLTLEQGYEQIKEFQRWVDSSDVNQKCYQVACRIQGMIKTTGVHAGAIIITPEDYANYLPAILTKGKIATQWDKDMITKRGILKIDLLGLSTLDIIADTIQGKDIDLLKIPLDDSEILNQFTEGNCVGVFQFDTHHLQKITKQLKVDSFHDIVVATTIARPASTNVKIKENYSLTDSYIARKHKEEKIDYPDNSIKEVLSDTMGYPIFQEQLMKMCNVASGGEMSLVDAEVVRDAMKHKNDDRILHYKYRFINGAMQRMKTSQIQAEKMWDMIEASSGYGYNLCLTGDCKVFKPFAEKEHQWESIENLYQKSKQGRGAIGSSTRPFPYLLSYDEENEILTPNRLKGIYYDGVKHVTEITLEDGFKIKGTLDHRLLSSRKDGLWQPIGDLRIGDYVGVMGKQRKRNMKGMINFTKRRNYDIDFKMVVSVSYFGQCDVYDIEMAKPYHSFVVNRIISHNSHASAYSILSYWCMYLKQKYPLDFLTACLKYTGTDRQTPFISEGKRLGIEIERVNLNKSKENFSNDGKRIYAGFSMLKGIGEKAGKELVNNQPYRTKKNLLDKVNKRVVNKRVVETLEDANCFNGKINYKKYAEVYNFNLLGKLPDLSLEDDLPTCEMCSLKDERYKVVCGSGIYPNDIMFVGQLPGRAEDRRGIPFVGKAGKLLRREWIPQLGLKAGEAYITNAVKCIALDEQGSLTEATEEQSKMCNVWLEIEIEKVKPKLIISLGSYALRALSQERSVTAMNGKEFEVFTSRGFHQGVMGFALFHPAYILRNNFDMTESLKTLKGVIDGISTRK